MQKRMLGNTGIEVGVIGFGGIPIQRVSQDAVDSIIARLHDEGANFIDTARGYTTSEEMIGRALRANFGDDADGVFHIATKSMARTYGAMKSDIETSLSNLGVSSIDVYQCHFVKDDAQYDSIFAENGAYRALAEAKGSGRIRHIGITSHSKEIVERAVREGIFETVQFPYNIIESQGEGVFSEARRKGIGVIVMKPLAGGAIENGPLAMRYIVQNPDVAVVIPGMESAEQVSENIAAVRGSTFLSDAETAEIALIRERFGNDFCRRCGYCLPCPQGIDIPAQFLFEGYLERYGLAEWAADRYRQLPVRADACLKCGICETKCPYDLKIRTKLESVAKSFSGLV